MSTPTNQERPKRYGLFSQKAYDETGYVIYSNLKGEHITCTMICDHPTDHKSGWKDAYPLGEVTEFIRSFKHEWRPRKNIKMKMRTKSSSPPQSYYERKRDDSIRIPPKMIKF